MNSTFQATNIYEGCEPPDTGERFETLLRRGRLEVERIVSSAQPDETLYEQSQDEWVVLVEGRAVLEVGRERVELARGDTLFLPAHTPHRVLETSAGALWLAVHLHRPDTEKPNGVAP